MATYAEYLALVDQLTPPQLLEALVGACKDGTDMEARVLAVALAKRVPALLVQIEALEEALQHSVNDTTVG